MSQPDTTTSDSRTETTVTKTFDSDDVEAFAELSGDTNPLHLDPEYAAETRFGEPIVHGALVTSLISAALAKFDGTVIYMSDTSEFLLPVYPGTELTATATTVDTSGGCQTVLTKVENGEGEKVVVGEAEIVIDEEEH